MVDNNPSDWMPYKTLSATYPYLYDVPNDNTSAISLKKLQLTCSSSSLLNCKPWLSGAYGAFWIPCSLSTFRAQNASAYNERLAVYNSNVKLTPWYQFWADNGFNYYSTTDTNVWTRNGGWGNQWSSAKIGAWITVTMYDGYTNTGSDSNQGSFNGNSVTIVCKTTPWSCSALSGLTSTDTNGNTISWNDRISSIRVWETPFTPESYPPTGLIPN